MTLHHICLKKKETKQNGCQFNRDIAICYIQLFLENIQKHLYSALIVMKATQIVNHSKIVFYQNTVMINHTTTPT